MFLFCSAFLSHSSLEDKPQQTVRHRLHRFCSAVREKLKQTVGISVGDHHLQYHLGSAFLGSLKWCDGVEYLPLHHVMSESLDWLLTSSECQPTSLS